MALSPLPDAIVLIFGRFLGGIGQILPVEG